MTFKDLPKDIRTRPLTDPRLRADMVDLLVGERDRRLGCVGVWFCDEDLIARQPVLITETGRLTTVEVRKTLKALLSIAADPVLVAMGRPGSSRLTPDDLTFAIEVTRACARQGITCLGSYIAASDGVREVPDALRHAS